jgi:hypothetical protein
VVIALAELADVLHGQLSASASSTGHAMTVTGPPNHRATGAANAEDRSRLVRPVPQADCVQRSSSIRRRAEPVHLRGPDRLLGTFGAEPRFGNLSAAGRIIATGTVAYGAAPPKTEPAPLMG